MPISVRVTFSDGDHLETSFNGDIESARAYYRGQVFNLGVGDRDRCVTCVNVVEVAPPFRFRLRVRYLFQGAFHYCYCTGGSPAAAVTKAIAKTLGKDNGLLLWPTEEGGIFRAAWYDAATDTFREERVVIGTSSCITQQTSGLEGLSE